jgi:hypothetical protein
MRFGAHLVMLLLAFVIVSSTATIIVADSRRMIDSEWGTRGVRVVLEKGVGTVEFDCAHGTINGPLKLDSRGRFNLTGTYVRERGGPVRADEQNAGEPAYYYGRQNGKQMTLTVNLKGAKEPLGTYTLTRDNPGRLLKCL